MWVGRRVGVSVGVGDVGKREGTQVGTIVLVGKCDGTRVGKSDGTTVG
jgi:hypothetical protein